jgi:hypothetical protein
MTDIINKVYTTAAAALKNKELYWSVCAVVSACVDQACPTTLINS